ncbi:hypothetical protein J3459_009811 [Metarhizium acridum]|nr:hypothetical protein J3459_009811 [Metarhizium acridum]
MKFSVASVLALATVAIAAPTKDHGRNQCNYVTCVDSALLVVDADIDLLGLLDIGLHVGLLENKQCKAFYCCPERCNEVCFSLLYKRLLRWDNTKFALVGRAHSRHLLEAPALNHTSLQHLFIRH